jgi:hypothetical protein
MWFTVIIVVYRMKYMKHIDILCGKNAELFNVTYVYVCLKARQHS